MIDANDFIAAEQYKKYGSIIPCGECDYWSGGEEGYGYCSNFPGAIIRREDDFCSSAKERQVNDDVRS